MPKKIREIKRLLANAGFDMRPGKGSHTIWTHQRLPGQKVVVAGNDGRDAPEYLERQAERAIRQAEGS